MTSRKIATALRDHRKWVALLGNEALWTKRLRLFSDLRVAIGSVEIKNEAIALLELSRP